MQITFAPPDAAEFAALYAETGWGDRSAVELERALAGSWIVCSARADDGVLLGIGRLLGDGVLHAFVTELIVTASARGRGVGTAILAALVVESRRRGVDDVQLFAASGRTAFYERNGFATRPADAPGMQAV